jgi:hypothetical protein
MRPLIDNIVYLHLLLVTLLNLKEQMNLTFYLD